MYFNDSGSGFSGPFCVCFFINEFGIGHGVRGHITYFLTTNSICHGNLSKYMNDARKNENSSFEGITHI